MFWGWIDLKNSGMAKGERNGHPMDMGEAAVPPRAAGPQRYKALAPWRFQSGFVRKEIKKAAAAAPSRSGVTSVGFSDAMGRGLGASGPSGKSVGGGEDCQFKRCTRSASTKNFNLEKSEEGGVDGDLGKSGGSKSRGDSGDCQLKRCTRSASVRDSNVEKLEKGGCRGAGIDGDLGKSCCNGGVEDPASDCMGNYGGCGGVSNAAGEDCNLELEGSKCNGTAHKFGSGYSMGAGNGISCNPEVIGSNATAEKCISKGTKKSCVDGNGLKSNGSSAADSVCEKPEGNGGSKVNGATKENDVAARAGNLSGPGCSVRDINCRKGRKVVAPWRFQIGYKRSFSKAFFSDSGSFETPKYMAQGSSTQCSPATRNTVRCYANAHSSVRVSAKCDLSVKGEKETRSGAKKRKTDKDDQDQARKNIIGSLQDFRLIYREVLDKEEIRSGEDLQAYRIFRERFFTECDEKKYVGSVPGVHVGDIFYLRVELCVVGLHRQHRVTVDHIKDEDGTCVAVSIVSYSQSSDFKNNLDVLVYSGSLLATGNQKIDGTNLALKKSMDTKTPIRVIHGFITRLSGNSQSKKIRNYIYMGLYLVEKYWREKESEGRCVYMFRLRRMTGQKHIDIKEILKSGQAKSPDGIIMKDISQGLERIPISVVNSISEEHPMPYRYISRLQYPRDYWPAPPAGCACVGGCSDSKMCSCSVKNGGEIPFNDKGCIVEAKPLVYECGPSCKCPPTCHNRVSQKGMKFRLQVFKTKSMGWGVKTLDFIPSGSFVCEYIGEVLHDEEAQKRKTDEYLFSIGRNYYDEVLWEGLSRSIPALQKGPGKDDGPGFAVDASKMGNFAKFINHSCTPNLYAQHVLYDHDDKSVPHVMFFAQENIPPRQELSYHYNYKIDEVHDVNGNIKKKECLCGSIECDRWLY